MKKIFLLTIALAFALVVMAQERVVRVSHLSVLPSVLVTAR